MDFSDNKNSLKDLNPEQKEAVEFAGGPLLIIAGAGTGKTTVITRRILNLIEVHKVKPEEILALTFTEKAAEEMEERVIGLLPISYVDLWISTFHSFCERVLKEYGLDIGLSTDFKLLDETQSWLFVRKNLEKFNLNYYRPLGNPTKFIHALINHFARCKDEGIYPEDYLKYSDDLRLNIDGAPIGSRAVRKTDKREIADIQKEADRVKEVADAYFVYQKLLLDNNFLDFGDLINYCLKLLKERPKILELYRRQFKHVLVDEFQDTNWVQYELVKLLAFPNNNLAVSADDDQSIYLFRGSSFNNVLQFRKDYPGAKEVVLIRNYRSPQNILDLSYKFIQLNNPNRLEYQMNRAEKISKTAGEKGINLDNFKKINKKLTASKEEAGIIKGLHFKNLEEEARGVVKRIDRLLKEDKEAALNDFAVLVRANSHAQPFCKELERNNFPYQFLASKGLYAKPVILDIIAYLKLLDNYHENSAVYRVLNYSFLNIHHEDIAKITQHSYYKGQSVYETLNQLPLVSGIGGEAIKKIDNLLTLIKKHTLAAREKNISEVFVDFLKESGYLGYLIKSEERENPLESYDAERNLELVNQFYDKIKKFENSQIDPSLKSFVEQLNFELESGEEGSLKFSADEGPDMIKVMTVHGAKGLEFKYVFLVNLVDRRFPSSEKKEPIEIPEKLVKEIRPEGDVHLQEERRLFYVGMTRAKKGLFFAWADDYGGARKKKISRFLVEAGIIKESNSNLTVFSNTDRFNFKTSNRPVKYKKELLPDHFSYSQLEAFRKCPLQYKFAHVLKIPRRGQQVFSFGKTMHQTLYKFLKITAEQKILTQVDLFAGKSGRSEKEDKKNVDFRDLLKIYEDNWIDEWYPDKAAKEKYFKKGKNSLKIFYDNFTERRPEIQFVNGKPALEQDFNLKIGGHLLIGQIDRIDKISSGSVEIIDYKTGNSKEKLREEERHQLLIYQMAAEEVLGLKPEKLTYHYLEEGGTVSFLGKAKEIEELKNKIIENIEKIKRNHFRPTPGWQCGFCDFKDICEHRANGK